MKCQRCGITLPNLGDADYKKAAEMEAEIASLKAELDAATGREAVLKAQAAEFYATEDGGWYAAWQSADRDRQALKAELENWRKRGSSVVANVVGMAKEIDQLKAENERLAADKTRLVEALEFYAEANNYILTKFLDAIIKDGGLRARQALKLAGVM